MSFQYLLDTNICIYIAKKKPIQVQEKLSELTVGEVGMSTITYGELMYGARKSQHPIKTQAILEKMTSLIPVLPIPIDAGNLYGDIRRTLEMTGQPIGNNDLWIAAHCLSLGITLISNNTKEFSRIKNLKLDNWV